MTRATTLLVLLLSAATAVAAPASSPHGGGGYQLPGNLLLNGRFDVAWERRGFSLGADDRPSQPFSDDTQNAFDSYHQFLFLSRHAPNDPFFFRAELLSQHFYEFGARFSPKEKGAPWQASVRFGKVIVPFGGEPLFHNSYGGLTAFDNRVLPAIWTRFGGVATGLYRLAGFTFTDDVYAIHGHRLPKAGNILNLQTDLAKKDDATIALGNRLGFGWGPFGGWWSAYRSALDHGRVLVMHAFDLHLWRFPDVPVLEDFTIAVGALRASIEGGGDDYYHFADYLTLRYYPVDSIYIQVRTGITRINNEEGFFEDEALFDQADTASHNIGVVYRRYGLSVGLFGFTNFEKRDEKDDDFLRLLTTFEF